MILLPSGGLVVALRTVMGGKRVVLPAKETPEHRESQTALAKEEGCILRLQGRRCKHHRHKLLSVDVQVFPNGVCVGPLVASKDQCVGEVAPQKAHVWFVSSGLTEETWQLISTPTENWLAAPLKVWSVEFTETSSVVASQLSIPCHACRNFLSLQSQCLVCLFHSESSGVQWLRDLCRFTASCWVLHHYAQINI